MSVGCSDLFSGRYRLRHRNELGEFPEVLSGSCEVELIARTVRRLNLVHSGLAESDRAIDLLELLLREKNDVKLWSRTIRS